MKCAWFILSIAMCCSTFNSHAQWTILNSGATNNLEAVQIINDSIGFVAGDGALILKTTNGGLSWFNCNNSSATSTFIDLDFSSDSIGYALNMNYFYKTTDQGANWQQLPTVISHDKRKIFFSNDSTGYCVTAYGSYLHTTDGGTTWVPENTGCGATIVMEDIFFLNDSYGYAGGWYATCFSYTTNGGVTWNASPGINPGQIYSLYFISAGTGYMAGRNGGYGYIMKTNDTGATWQLMNTGVIPAINSIYCPDANTCYAVGDSGTVVKTVDGGLTWQTLISGTTQKLKDIFCLNSNTCYVAGDSGVILKTTNGGVGIHPVDDAAEVKLFPNPAMDKINIEVPGISGKLNLELTTILGEHIVSNEMNNINNPTLDIQSLPSGVYILKISVGERVFIRKIIKQREN